MDIELWWEFVGFCPVVGGRGRRWKVRGSGARGGGPACDYPTWPCCGGRGEWGVLVHKPALDHSEGWERLLTSAAGWVGISEGNGGGVCWGHEGP